MKRKIISFFFIFSFLGFQLTQYGSIYMHPRQVYWAFSDNWEKHKPNSISDCILLCSVIYKDLDVSLLPHPGFFINLYGFIQNCLQKNYIYDKYTPLVKLTNGYISLYPEINSFGQSNSISQFQKQLAQIGVNFVYIQCPHKIYKYQNNLPRGIKDKINPFCDDFLSQLNSLGVECIDTREIFRETPNYHYENYFRADHHWKEQYPFLVCTKLAQIMQEKGIIFNEKYLEKSNYKREKKHLAPSEYIRVGKYYVKPDPETRVIYTPEAEKDNNSISDMDNAFLQKENPIAVKLGNPDGLSCYYNSSGSGTIVFICDSYGEQLTHIFSSNYQYVYRIDPRIFDKHIFNLIKDINPDMVIVMYWPESLNKTKCFVFNKEYK